MDSMHHFRWAGNANMIKRLLFTAAILIAVVWTLTLVFGNQADTTSRIVQERSRDGSALTTNVQLRSGFQFPFSNAEPPKIDHAAVIAARTDRMRKLHYTTPERYNQLGIKELDKLARSSDRFAAVQLGERYWSEKESAEWDPDFDVSQSNKAMAEKYFSLAIRGGIFMVSDAVAAKAAEEGDVVNAKAWDMISSKLRDISPYEREVNANIRPLSDAEQRQAAEQAKKIWSEIGFAQ